MRLRVAKRGIEDSPPLCHPRGRLDGSAGGNNPLSQRGVSAQVAISNARHFITTLIGVLSNVKIFIQEKNQSEIEQVNDNLGPRP